MWKGWFLTKNMGDRTLITLPGKVKYGLSVSNTHTWVVPYLRSKQAKASVQIVVVGSLGNELRLTENFRSPYDKYIL